MKYLILALGLCSVWALTSARPDWIPGLPERTYTEYGPNVEKEGFCPRTPRESLCDTNFCIQVRHNCTVCRLVPKMSVACTPL